MVAYGENRHPLGDTRYYCSYVAQRDAKQYVHDHEDIMAKYGPVLKMSGDIPQAIADEMGDHFYIADFNDFKDVKAFAKYCLEEKVKTNDIVLDEKEDVAAKSD